MGRTTKPCVKRPMSTVMKYSPSCPATTERSSISRICNTETPMPSQVHQFPMVVYTNKSNGGREIDLNMQLVESLR